jgi:hypothetical protein
MNREAWLTDLAERYALPLIRQHQPKFAADKYRVSCGFPKGRGGRGTVRIGECWSHSCSGDGVVEIFISPTLEEPVEVAAVLVHELVHFAVGNECGHKGDFRRVAKAVGLEGKMTATVAGEALKVRIKDMWLADMPPYPHAALKPAANVQRPGSRLLKMACECGFTIRITAKWLEQIGFEFQCPHCHDQRVLQR